MAEKTEKPTEKRRRESAQKGQSFKVKDVTTTVVLVSGIAYLGYGMSFEPFIAFYNNVILNGESLSYQAYLISLAMLFMELTLPMVMVCFIAGTFSTLLQTRMVLATKAIKLNFDALNPMKGLKRIFNMRTLKELVKTFCYVGVFAVSVNYFQSHYLSKLLSTYQGNIWQVIRMWSDLAVKLVFIYVGVSLIVLVLDGLCEYFLQFKDMKMEKHEVKQEHKENEGNPEIKSARRNAHFELLSGSEQAAIRSSEMILANPTHIAMGIFFNPDVAMLPFITLRASNMKARAIIAYAEKVGVPVVRSIPLARRLYKNYSVHSFISLNDNDLIEIMRILIWLKQVESAGQIGEEQIVPSEPPSEEKS
ncbi:Surface presentation of antigens protein SpaS [Sodalis praecaptivus]|uniref:EscU/YscU/HrcU family type III secretion system export apparatus switch protein n=1 Tax=Sodalis praecaptivus TaxID=1239307 RepID=UPI0027F8242C|nr:EscU/YscU/HrcU family type III secretion system export apparatus switch protein [Sodalis praecaptivus]CAJ0998471.1 Surface presentation of antigens protein SpaS [Sodalis praecaptivus]